MIESRRLWDKNDEFFEHWRVWKQSYPRIFTEIDDLHGRHEDLSIFAEDHENFIQVGVSEDGVPLAIITFRHAGDGWFEIHLDAKRGFNADQYAPVVWAWGWSLFEMGAYALYGWMADSSRAAKRIGEKLGLEYDGTVRWLGVYRGKVIYSKRYTLYRTTWLQWKYSEVNNGQGAESRTEAGHENSSGHHAGTG